MPSSLEANPDRLCSCEALHRGASDVRMGLRKNLCGNLSVRRSPEINTIRNQAHRRNWHAPQR